MLRTASMSMLFLLFLAPSLVSQSYFGCENALEICNKETLLFRFNSSQEFVRPELATPCEIDGPSSIWVTWQIEAPGNFTFTIIPKDSFYFDVDFAVYRLGPAGDCSQMEQVRCMCSGISLGSPVILSLPCLGATGLSVTESPHQTVENAGCDELDNNFLAALDCKKGERYALAIACAETKDFDFYVLFCGTALLACDTTHCEEVTPNHKALPEKSHIVWPFETATDSLPLYLFDLRKETVKITIQDSTGKTVSEQTILYLEQHTEYRIPLPGLPAGEYQLNIKTKKKTAKGRFTKL